MRRTHWMLAVACLAMVVGCQRLADTRPLREAGMEIEPVQRLYELKITDDEVAELVTLKNAGASDAACVELLRIARSRKTPFDDGETLAGLMGSGFSEKAVQELYRLGQLGLWVGEARTMRLAGVSEETILILARHRAEGRAVLSGPALARLKNAGLSERFVLELARHGATDEVADQAITLRKRGAREDEILRSLLPQP